MNPYRHVGQAVSPARPKSAFLLLLAAAAVLPPAARPTAAIAGRWDITVRGKDGPYPSWVEFEPPAKGRFVGRTGGVHALGFVHFDGRRVEFRVPEGGLSFLGTLANGRIEGSTWTAVRAPALARGQKPVWGRPERLTDIAGWSPTSGQNHWRAENGELVNEASGANLASRRTFSDFKLHLEFNIPAESDSGVYLRGRYEIEIAAAYGLPPDAHGFGSIYGFLKPSSNPARRSGEWQSIDAILVGRKVTVTVNGTGIIHDAGIPGITGGALDSNEGAPGPLMLQGDHGRVSYRNIVVTPSS